MTIIDGSRHMDVEPKLRQLGAWVYRQKAATVGGSRREALFYAIQSLIDNGVDPSQSVLIWAEPEKYDIVRLIPTIIEPIDFDSTLVVIAGRTPKSWSTYPEFQQQSEHEANAVYAQITGRAA